MHFQLNNIFHLGWWISYFCIALTKWPERTTLKEERFIWAHMFKGSSLSWQRKHGGEGAERREWRKGPGQDTAKRKWSLWPTFSNYASAPTFYHFPIMPLHFKSMKGLIHSLGQNPQDLIVSGNVLTDTEVYLTRRFPGC
jgi:hypothetical protein